MGPAWDALKAVFPDDYHRLIQEMTNALIEGRDWQAISQAFIQSHVVGQVENARQAPPDVQLRYQQQKAGFLTYLAESNVEACALLGTGVGDPSSLAELKGEAMRRYALLIAETVTTIGAGRDSPVSYSDLTPSDVSQIVSALVSQGASEAEARAILSGQSGNSASELCRVGVLRNKALAAVPAEVVAKVAFR